MRTVDLLPWQKDLKTPNINDLELTITQNNFVLYFRTTKQNGEFRMILNLKQLNDRILYFRFKMGNFENVLNLVSKDMYFCTLDICKAYYSIPLEKQQQTNFRFLWKGQIFQYTCMPNGVSPGPKLFTKLMKPVYAKLRTDGFISTCFIDVSLLAGENLKKCKENVQATSCLMTRLEYLLNYEKRVLEPTQRITFLGNIIDSRQMVVILPEEKKDGTKANCQKLYSSVYATIRFLAKVIGSGAK